MSNTKDEKAAKKRRDAIDAEAEREGMASDEFEDLLGYTRHVKPIDRRILRAKQSAAPAIRD